MATLLDLLVDQYEAPDEAAVLLREAEQIRAALRAAPTEDSWQVFWRFVADCYDTEEDLAMALDVSEDFTDTAFVG